MTLLAQSDAGRTEPPEYGFSDNLVLDEFYVPFGDWMSQAIDWVLSDLRWLLSAIKWPFTSLNDLLVRDIMQPVSWFWVVVAFFLIGTLARNVRVGVFAAGALTFCGFLGPQYWDATIQTIGFVLVAVLLCVMIGIPTGIACARVDAVWRVVRPVLDAMQVVHAFVYMLPFIAFFGLGNVGATIVTMAFALPPLVRLTNLGIRQVPEDVVEACRAYGAAEWRVLTDVQLPLARAAIMTGVNQTLLLAMSMLGIAAIMGAQGLGALLFGAISRQSVTEGVAAGLAFYLVAVVFDRISQPEGAQSGGLLRRTRRAWAARRDPSALLEAQSAAASAAAAEPAPAPHLPAPLGAAERRAIVASAAGGVLTALSALLVWNSDAGFLSAYGRVADQQRPGESFIGLSASGGSWFAILALLGGLFIVTAAVAAILAPGRGPRWWAADFALVASLALLVMMAGYLLARPAAGAVSPGIGAGAWLALVGAVTATLGSLRWIGTAPHAAIRPLGAGVGWGRVGGASFAAATLVVAALSAWSFDERAPAAVGASGETADRNRVIIDGISSAGAGLGIWVMLAGFAGLAAALPAAGVFGRDECRRWRWSSVTAGVGVGAAFIGVAWVFTQVRSADSGYVSGVGSFLAVAGGLTLAATAAPVLREFRRAQVYSSEPGVTAAATAETAETETAETEAAVRE
ncbi:MAG: ABC transporter permease subunit [Acidimicrobiaceae bacterium]|nr:ABC transporter permease subunit [Acidimicrobiaceae bacterium]